MSENMIRPLQSYLQNAFPERRNLAVRDLTSISTGWESDVYGFSAEWELSGRAERDDLILRIYPGVDAYEKSASEFRNLTLLDKAGYPVPRVDCLERDYSPFDKPFIIMERIIGRQMWDAWFHSPPAEQQKRLEQFCRLFARLHQIDWRPLVPDPAEFEPAGPYAVVERQINRWKPYVYSLPLPGFYPGWEWLEEHQRDVPSTSASVVHWDFHPANILINAKDEAVVIDWTQLELTDYRFDLGWTLALICSYEGGQWRDRILREYERQSGRKVEGMKFFDAFACLRRLFSVIGSLSVGAEQFGMRPGAEEIMRKQVGPLKKVYAQFQRITGLRIPEADAFLS